MLQSERLDCKTFNGNQISVIGPIFGKLRLVLHILQIGVRVEKYPQSLISVSRNFSTGML